MPDWMYNLNLQDEKIRTSTEIKEQEQQHSEMTRWSQCLS
jgi:hypothetical protein